jgi:hypothetical protein
MHQIRPGVWVDDPLPGAAALEFTWNNRDLVLTLKAPPPEAVMVNGRRYVPAKVDRSAEMELEPPTRCEKDR